MKKFLSFVLAFCMIATSLVFVPLTVVAEDAVDTIYVSADGNDSNSGTAEAPVATVGKAIALVADNGIIKIVGTFKPSSHNDYAGSALGKTVTVTSDNGTGIIDFSAIQFVQLKNNMTFENVSLNFASDKTCYLFACGYELVIKESVTFAEGSGTPHVFGGAYQESCGSTSITLLAGKYKNVHGASHDNNFDITGDTYVHVGGTASAANIFGAGSKSDVKGNTFVLVDGNAKASYVYGAGTGAHDVTGNTNVTVGGSANVKIICGGSSDINGTINGNTYVTVKDSANQESAPSNSNHSGNGYMVFGGGKGIIKGNTNVYFKDNAMAGYVVGGMADNSSGSIAKGANVYMMGGTTYSIYGCGRNVDHGTGATITMTGGTAAQVFGGCESANAKGPITIKLFGGTVTRRVFGGCYNNAEVVSYIPLKTEFTTGYSVDGNIVLILGKDANVSFTYKDAQYGTLGIYNDHSLSAHSRRGSVAEGENATIIHVNGSNAASKLTVGPNAGGTTHEVIHGYTYTISGSIVTQTCTCGKTSTATITPTGNLYTGNEIEVDVEYDDNWEYETFDISYVNNKNVGEATAKFSIDGFYDFIYNYTISKAITKAPTVSANNNKITGITTYMEYSSNGVDFVDVTDANMTFEDGVYYVRFKETDSVYASAVTKVYFGNCISANKVNTIQGATVEIIVQVPSNTGIDELNVSIDYDDSVLTLVGMTAAGFAGAALENDTIIWNGSETTKTGVLAKLTFKVSEDAAFGDYAIELSADGFAVANGEISVSQYVYGDVNGVDGKVTVSDIAALRRAIVNETLDDLANGADVNGDGVVNTVDIVMIRQYIASYNYTTGESGIVLGCN